MIQDRNLRHWFVRRQVLFGDEFVYNTETLDAARRIIHEFPEDNELVSRLNAQLDRFLET
jgi:hypothetical protein